jgi:hypothetical protein
MTQFSMNPGNWGQNPESIPVLGLLASLLNNVNPPGFNPNQVASQPTNRIPAGLTDLFPGGSTKSGLIGYGEPNYATGSRSPIMKGASAPKTPPVKQPSGVGNNLASSLVTRPHLNLTTSSSYPGYGDRGPLTVPTSSGYVPQTAPPLVPGAYTIPGYGGLTGLDQQTNPPAVPFGPTPDYYGMQETWTPQVSGK